MARYTQIFGVIEPKSQLTLDNENLYDKIKFSLKAVNVSVDIYLLPEKTGHRVETGPSSGIY